MEMSMYQDNDTDKRQELKRNMCLDLVGPNSKQKKFQNMLESPPESMKLASPELEKFYIAQNGTVGTTPTPSQFVYPPYVTDEQEAYARGFVEALANLHSTPADQSQMPMGPTSTSNNIQQPATNTYSTLMPMNSSSMPNTTNSYTASSSSSLANMPSYSRRHAPFAPSGLTAPHIPHSTYNNVQVKAEPTVFPDHTVPASPDSSRITDSPSASALSPGSLSGYDQVENVNRLDSIPVDLEEQEKIKLERKRARNRIAARKCRTRKLERIGRLEEKVADLKSRNNELNQTVASLSEQAMHFKSQLMEHMKAGCQIMIPETNMMMRPHMGRPMHM